jgi:hypothetical protein
MRHTIRLIAVTMVLAGPALSGAPAAQGGAAPPKAASDIRLTTTAGFTVDYPKKDWTVLGGTGASVVVFFHKSKEATVAVERTKLRRALASSDITDQTAALEVEDWQNRRPLATGFSSQIKDYGDGRFIVIDFAQPGPLGPERVRMYTTSRGLDRFRVICTTTQGTLEKYLDTCHKIALSLTPTPQ